MRGTTHMAQDRALRVDIPALLEQVTVPLAEKLGVCLLYTSDAADE